MAKIPPLDRREIIAGIHGGIANSWIRDQWNDSGTGLVNTDEINSENHPSPSAGFFLEYQMFNNVYLQLEYNNKEYVYYKDDWATHYIKIWEIPVLLKYMLKTKAGRFSILMGAAYRSIYETGGFFEDGMDMTEITEFSLRQDGVTPMFGFEYSHKINRHIFNLGMRFSSTSILEYYYHDVAENWDYDAKLVSDNIEFLAGYGYNFGGSGDNIQTEESRFRWLFPVHAGYLFYGGGGDDETKGSGMAAGGILYSFQGNVYFGITGFGFQEGGGPLVTVAWSRDPDNIINSFGFVVLPIGDETIAAGMYSLAFKRVSMGILFAGAIGGTADNSVLGITAGYYF